MEDWLLHNLVSQFAQYNLELEARTAQQVQKVDESKVRRKMDKLKDLYLNDLIDRDAYEKDYTTLRDELRAATAAREKLPEPVNLKEITDALSAYSELSKEHKKEFWARIIGRIVVTNEDDFFVYPISP